MFRLTPEAEARAAESRRWLAERQSQFASMSDESLVANAKFYMRQMTPVRFAPGEPVYDATFWHVIVPEVLKRISDRDF